MLDRGASTFAELKISLQKFPFDLKLYQSKLVARYIFESDSISHIHDETS
jgi:hypothetical protein